MTVSGEEGGAAELDIGAGGRPDGGSDARLGSDACCAAAGSASGLATGGGRDSDGSATDSDTDSDTGTG